MWSIYKCSKILKPEWVRHLSHPDDLTKKQSLVSGLINRGGRAAFCSKLFRLLINTRGAIWFELFSTKINKLFIFHQPYSHFLLKSLQKNSCRLLHGNSYPGAVAADKTRRGPACLPVCPQSPVGEQSTWKLEHSIHPEIPPWARPFSRGLLFLSGVFRIFLEAELRLTSRRWPYETMPERSRRNSHWVSSPSVARGGGAHRAQRVSVLHRAVIDASVWGRWSVLGSVIPEVSTHGKLPGSGYWRFWKWSGWQQEQRRRQKQQT